MSESESERFDRLTAEWGGRFPVERAPDAVRETYEEVAERANDLIAAARRILPGLPPIHFDFIWNSRVNAVAFFAEEQYFIGVHTGMLYMLRSVIGRMLADGRLFPEIGDASKEASDLKPLEDYYPDAEEMLRSLAVMTPKDPLRRAYAWFLQDQAEMFFVGHELAHITQGHVAYLAKKGQGATSEVGLAAGRDERAILQRQGIELDADGRSIVSRIDSLRITYQNPSTPALPWAPVSKGPGQMIQDWATSMNILFRIFGDERFSMAGLAQTSYPPLFLRRMMCNMAALANVVQIWDLELKKTAYESLLAAQTETDGAFDAILGAESVEMPMPDADVKTAQAHMRRIEEVWDADLRPELRKLAFG